jgi:hypothetical protein
MKSSTSLFAKALATENIFVSFDSSAKTALFDVESRTLVIPDWKVSDILRDMIVAHEVAHALFTPPEQLISAMMSARERKLNPDGYKACINVIEDARIERLIKEKFPGCRRDFYAGYKEIMDTDLFELKNIPVEDLTIVDKINLHFKFGLFGLMNIAMTSAEQKIIDRVAAAKTFDDVIAIANDLYDMAAEEEKQKGKTSVYTKAIGVDALLDKGEKNGNLDKVLKGGKINREDFPFLSYALPKANHKAAIISFGEIITEMNFVHDKMVQDIKKDRHGITVAAVQGEIDRINGELDKYRKESSNAVRELVAQFERRKAAEEIRKERMKPTGEINPDRLHQFKTHDDIFLRNLVKHEGKKHGMVMLIDWSGSMSECLDGTVRQLLMLTWFCRKAKIPFDVFTYTERSLIQSVEQKYDHEKSLAATYGENYVKMLKRDNSGVCFSDTTLRQVFSSDMTDEEMLKMEQMLWRMATLHSPMYRTDPLYNYYLVHHIDTLIPNILHLHGTPTCEALMIAHSYIPHFRAKHGSDIVDFILITDGDPTGLSRTGNTAYIPVKGVRIQNLATGRTMTVEANNMGYLNSLQSDIQFFLVDEIRKLGCVTVGFAIGSHSGLGSHYNTKFVLPKGTDYNNSTTMEASYKTNNDFYRKENFIPACPDKAPGFDEFYIVRPVKPNNEEMDKSITAANSTLTKIRNQFLKSLTTRKNSRVFLSRFIDLIAGRKVSKFKIMGK